jgi:hypothetical protein
MIGKALAVLVGLAGLAALATPLARVAQADPLALCGNAGPATASIQHVLVVVLENKSYNQVLGKSAYPTSNTLAASCGVGTKAFGASHTSASNYFGLVSGAVGHFSGCGTVSGCSSPGRANLFSQLDAAGLTWMSYQEGMPGNCWSYSTGKYKIGHNPAMFYGLPDCSTNDVPVTDLTATSGALYDALTNQTLPSYAFITPSLTNDGEGSGGYRAADKWLGKFVAVVQASPSYQTGNTLLLITNDEGTGSDAARGEDCTNQARDLAGLQESCHIPFFVVYPWASGKDATFFDHYSVTRTVEDLFGLSPIAGAAGAPSLVGHFGISLPEPTPTPTPSPTS